jgi:hypothetical protein
VPVVPRGEGVFCYRGERLDGRRTPLCYGMEGGARVDFFLEMRPSAFVTITVRDGQGPEVTRTMRRADPMRGLIDFYYAMTTREEGTFVNFNGRQISPEDTPMELEMEGDENSDRLPWEVVALQCCRRMGLTALESTRQRISATGVPYRRGDSSAVFQTQQHA